MAPEGSITRCITLLRQGEDAAAQVIWERYFPQLVRLARSQLARVSSCTKDEEDIALSALDRFCRAVNQGRYPQLADRHGLWRLLLQITSRRLHDQRRYERRQRRGGGHVYRASDVAEGADRETHDLDDFADDAPTPEFAALMAEQCGRLLSRLDDPQLQALATAKLDGTSNSDLATQLGCSVRTVERRLKLIRDIWREEEPE
jgi:DNA-directed RNA polymerase specialized sigma24 family protein